jgi:MFS family permease
MGRFFSYQVGLAILLGLVAGLVFFDRNAINFLSPLLVADLKLSNAQLGAASSVLSLSWAATGYLVGRRSDRAGRRKPYLVAAILVFSLCSMASGLVGGFPGLILARLLMGAAEGPVPILGIALVIAASAPERRGLNQGLVGLCGLLISGALAPVLLVGVATHLGWRAAFFLSGIPGLLLAVAVAVYVREARGAGDAAARRPTPGKRRGLEVLRIRNVWLCGVISSLLVAGLTVIMVFAPVFMVGFRHFKPAEMGMVMSVFGLASMAGGLVLSALSDRVGRRPIVITIAMLAAAALWALYGAGTPAVLAAAMAVAGLGGALPGMTIGMIPGESVADRDRGTALGITMGAAEVFGSFAAATLAGLAADHFGQDILPAVAAGCFLAAGILSLALGETAPRRIGTANFPVPALASSE